MIYFIIILGILAIDRLVKWVVASNMSPGDSIPVIENIFHITSLRNQGAAFSSFSGQTALLILIPAVAMIVGISLIVIKRKKWHPFLLTAISFICAGGIGNIIDRAMQGYVVDMFDFRVFPIFNVADIFVCVGCAMVVIYILFIEEKANKNKSR